MKEGYFGAKPPFGGVREVQAIVVFAAGILISCGGMSLGETENHKKLKRLSFSWAGEQGYSCRGFEISLPHSGYRADVAAYKPASESRAVAFQGRAFHQAQAIVGTTAVFECKQSRADLLKDSCRAEKTRDRLKQLHERRMVLERLLRIHCPSAANGDSLFQEYESYNFEAAGHKGYRRVLSEISGLQNALLRKNKLEKLIRYRCANLFYLVTVDGIIAEYELPLNCGLLVMEGDSLKVIRKPIWQESPEGSRLAVLQRIALAATRRLDGLALAMSPAGIEPAFKV